MFENITEKQPGRGKRLFGSLFAAVIFYGLLFGFLVFFDTMRVEAVPQPPAIVTFVDFASLPPPPPPPPPPPKKKSATPKPEVKPEELKPQPRIKEFVAPKVIPQDQPKAPEQLEPDADHGVPGGVEGGVPNGVVGSIIGAEIGPTPPQPPPRLAPPQPKYQAPAIIKKRRVQGEDPVFPRIARAAGLEATIIVKLFISPEGEVIEMLFQKSDAHFEQAVREAVKDWRFSPLLINGSPVGTYTVYKFVFKLE